MQPDNPSAQASAPQPPVPAKPRRKRWPIFVVVGLIALIIFSGIGFFTASALEEHDTFCISCHTVPETTYYNRAYISLDNPNDKITDLATMHYHLYQQKNQDFACIDCHRGDAGLGNRISAIALGARDSVIYVTGHENPTIEKTQTSEGWLSNAACVSCHTDTLLKLEGLDNHFHTHLPQAAQALANGGKLTVPDKYKSQEAEYLNTGLKTVNTSLACTDCHQAHKTLPNGAANFFMDVDMRNQACVTCHKDAKEGPLDPKSLGQS